MFRLVYGIVPQTTFPETQGLSPEVVALYAVLLVKREGQPVPLTSCWHAWHFNNGPTLGLTNFDPGPKRSQWIVVLSYFCA